jgi:hypothetical protein
MPSPIRFHRLLPPLIALVAGAASAELKVTVQTRPVDEDDQHCFMHGTLSTQDIDVENTGTAPVTASLFCEVPGQLLRVAAKTPPRTIAPGKTERMNCSLYDYQDPPVAGASVDFEVEVNGVKTTHATTVQCRDKTPSPHERCAAARLSAAGAFCSEGLQALAVAARGGRSDVALERLEIAHEGFLDAIERTAEACPAGPDLAEMQAALVGLGADAAEIAAHEETGACGAAKLRALARKCTADAKAWTAFALRGDPDALTAALARSDAGFERRFARTSRRCGDGAREELRLAVDEAIGGLAEGHGLDAGPGHALLLAPELELAPGEREKRAWLPMPAAGALELPADRDLHAVAYDRSGTPIGAAGGALPNAASLRLPEASDHYTVVLRRSGDLGEARSVPLRLTFDEPAEVFYPGAELDDPTIFSPLRTVPIGDEVQEVPPGFPAESFTEYVEKEFGWDLETGMPALLWLAESELVGFACPAGAAGPRPPQGASHDQNYCAVSTFVHSMETTFPGSLPANVKTDPDRWDEVAWRMGHVNLWGTPGFLFTGTINRNWTGVEEDPQLKELVEIDPLAEDGKYYCAAKLSDVSPSNLAAWREDCDLKLLAYQLALPNGHWVNVDGVTPDPTAPGRASLKIQDYEESYSVGYQDASGDPQVDFLTAAPGSAMRELFGSSNTLAGDDWFEPLGFYVVCECDKTTPLYPELPSQTKSGKPLLP